MLYSRYETEELKDEKGKVVGHKRVRKAAKAIEAQEKPAPQHSQKDRKSNAEMKAEKKAPAKKEEKKEEKKAEKKADKKAK